MSNVNFKFGAQDSYDSIEKSAGDIIVTDSGRMYVVSPEDETEGGGTNYLIGESLDKINVGANNNLLGNNCSAIGTDNIAGSRGYRIVQVTLHSGTEYDVIIEVSESTIEQTLSTLNFVKYQSEGNYNRVGIRLSNHYQGTLIECIQNDSTHIDLIVDFYSTISTSLATDSEGNTYKTGDYNTLFLLSYPDFGEEVIHNYCFAEGYNNTASGNYSTVLSGYGNIAWGKYSVAEGVENEAGYAGHVEGRLNKANGESAHAQNHGNEASGAYSDATGLWTTSKGRATTSIGKGTIATSEGSLALGRFNKEDNEGKFALIIGNGRSSKDSGSRDSVLAAASRSNAYELSWQGDGHYYGNLNVDKSTVVNKDLLVKEKIYIGTDRHPLYQSIAAFNLIPITNTIPFEFDTTNKKLTCNLSYLYIFDKGALYQAITSDTTVSLPLNKKINTDGSLSTQSSGGTGKCLLLDRGDGNRLKTMHIDSIDEARSNWSSGVTKENGVDKSPDSYLARLSNNYYILMMIMANGSSGTLLQQITSPGAISYKGAYSINGAIYNAPQSYQVTVPCANWSNYDPSTGHSQSIEIPSILATDNPVVDVVLTGTASSDKAKLESYSCVTYIKTAANKITLYCAETCPSSDFDIQLQVIR